MNKIGYFVLFLTIFAVLLTQSAAALDTDSILPELAENLPPEVASQLPDEVTGLLSGEGDAVAAAEGPGFQWVLSLILDALGLNRKTFLTDLALLVSVLLFSALINTFSGENAAVGGVMKLISALCVSGAVCGIVGRAWTTAKNAVSLITVTVSAAIPAMTAVCAASGNITTATVGSTGFALLLSLFERIISDVLTPLIGIVTALTVTSSVCDGNASPAGFCAFLKRTYTVSLTFIMTVFGLSVSYQTSLAKSADGLLLRTVRFAAGNFVPVVGGAVSEASSTMLGSLALLRTTVGTVGAAAAAAAAMAPIVSLAITGMTLNAAAAVAGLLGCGKEAAVITETAGIITMMTATTICCAVMMLFVLSLLGNVAAA